MAGAGLGLLDALGGVVNVLPIGLVCLGAALVAPGLAPRLVALLGSLPAAGGFLWQVSADSVDAPARVAGLSSFAHLAPVPAEPSAWAGGGRGGVDGCRVVGVPEVRPADRLNYPGQRGSHR